MIIAIQHAKSYNYVMVKLLSIIKGQIIVTPIPWNMDIINSTLYLRLGDCDRVSDAGHDLTVQMAVVDFESAVWKAVRQVIPHADMRGCSFHWGQAVFRHLQSLGLQTAYHSDPQFHRYCQQLLALSCLPVQTIAATLQQLESEATTADRDSCATTSNKRGSTPARGCLQRGRCLNKACILTTTSKAGTGVWITKQAEDSWTCTCCCSCLVPKPSCWKYSWLFWKSHLTSGINMSRVTGWRRVCSLSGTGWLPDREPCGRHSVLLRTCCLSTEQRTTTLH